MGDAPTTHAGVPMDGTAIEPTLVLTFFGNGNGGTQRRAIPRGGLLLGREEVVFDDAFDDFRMAPRHAEVRVDDGRVLIRDLGSEIGTRLNGQLLVGERALEPGDVLRLGDTLLVYAPASPSSAMPEPELIGTSATMVAVRRSVVEKTYDAEMAGFSTDGAWDSRAIDVIRSSLKELGILSVVPDATALYTDKFVPVKIAR